MHAGQLGGQNDLVGIGLSKATDIVGNGAVKQLNILRQIADVRAQFCPIPGSYIRTIKPDLTSCCRPDAQNCSRQA